MAVTNLLKLKIITQHVHKHNVVLSGNTSAVINLLKLETVTQHVHKQVCKDFIYTSENSAKFIHYVKLESKQRAEDISFFPNSRYNKVIITLFYS